MFVWIKDTLIVFIALLAPLWIVAGLNYSGFCWEQKRWLSDEEKIRRIVEQQFLYQPEVIYGLGEGVASERSNPATRYETVEHFLEKNPDCCRVDLSRAGGDTLYPTLWDKLWNYYTDIVVVKYGAKHINSFGENSKESLFLINNCAKEYDN